MSDRKTRYAKWRTGEWINIGVHFKGHAARHELADPDGAWAHVIQMGKTTARAWTRWTTGKKDVKFGVIYIRGRLYRGYITDIPNGIGWIEPGMGYFETSRFLGDTVLRLDAFCWEELDSEQLRCMRVPYVVPNRDKDSVPPVFDK